MTMKPMIPHQVRLLGPNLWVGKPATSSVKRGSRIMRSPARDCASGPSARTRRSAAIPHGTTPTASAQGEKIDATNTIPTAIAVISGHRLAAGTGSRRSGAAATTVVRSISFSSTRRPVTTGSSPSLSHSGVRSRRRGYARNYRPAAASWSPIRGSPRPTGSARQSRRGRATTRPLTTNRTIANARTNAPMVESRFGTSSPRPAG